MERTCEACGRSLIVDGALRFDMRYWSGKNHLVCKGECAPDVRA
jgi:hypothetical protein